MDDHSVLDRGRLIQLLQDLQDHRGNEEMEESAKRYFRKLADFFHRQGIFLSRDEAREVINEDPFARAAEIDPDTLSFAPVDPNVEADAILALAKPRDFTFAYPLARFYSPLEWPFEVEASSWRFRLAKVTEVLSPSFDGSARSEEWLFLRGSMTRHRYVVARRDAESLVQQVAGAMLVMEIIHRVNRHWPDPAPRLGFAPAGPWNERALLDSPFLHTAQALVTGPLFGTSFARGLSTIESEESRLRIVQKLFTADSDDTRRARQACRMFLRAHDCWGDGEAAMLLTAALEGMLLDKRNRDDLSARLQDSVAYWLGPNGAERAMLRNRVRSLYEARSKFVHEGAMDIEGFSLYSAFLLVRDVIQKELIGLKDDGNAGSFPVPPS